MRGISSEAAVVASSAWYDLKSAICAYMVLCSVANDIKRALILNYQCPTTAFGPLGLQQSCPNHQGDLSWRFQRVDSSPYHNSMFMGKPAAFAAAPIFQDDDE